MKSWTCNGVTKNSQQYPDKGGSHQPYENFGPDCVICGLPQEAMETGKSARSKGTTSTQVSSAKGEASWKLLAAALITLGLIGGIVFLFFTLFKPCPTGEQRQGLGCVAIKDKNRSFDPAWVSSGDRVFFGGKANTYRDQGLAAFKAGNYREAVQFLERGVSSNRNDPEVQIYLNNARARLAGSPLLIATVVPVEGREASAQEMLRGVADAQTSFNDQGGLGGQLVEIVIANDGNDPNRASSIAENLAKNRNILGIIGHNSSDVSKAALAEYEKVGLAMISPTSTSTELSSQFFFRTVPSDTASGRKLAEYARKTLNISQVAVFYNPNSSYSNSLREAFEINFQNLGGTIAKSIDLSDPNLDPQQQMQTLQGQVGAIALFPNTATTSVAIALARANYNLGVPKLLMLGGDALYSSDTLNAGGNAVDGLIIPVPWFSGEQPYAEQASQRWVGNVNWRTAASFDATQALLSALSNNPTRTTVLQRLRYTNLPPTETSGDPLSFANGERIGEPVLVRIAPNVPGKPRNFQNGFELIPDR